MKRFMVLTSVILMGSLAFYVAAAQAKQAENEKSTTSKDEQAQQQRDSQDAEAFLGIGVEAVHPSLAPHLHAVLTKGQGVMVEQVAQNSPAAKAGLKRYDIIAAFGDQRLYSPEQLVKLVRAEKPGSKISLEVIRDGKKENIEVTLGEGQEQMREEFQGNEATTPRGGHVHTHPMIRAPHGFVRVHPRSGPAEWEQFDSMNIQKTGKDQFKVAISYLDEKGKTERHEFEGTREEIHKAIQGEKDLPGAERAHLMRALDMEDHGMGIPGVRFIPGEGFVIDLGNLAPSESEPQQQPSSGASF